VTRHVDLRQLGSKGSQAVKEVRKRTVKAAKQ
jgi:hypothetical protein